MQDTPVGLQLIACFSMFNQASFNTLIPAASANHGEQREASIMVDRCLRCDLRSISAPQHVTSSSFASNNSLVPVNTSEYWSLLRQWNRARGQRGLHGRCGLSTSDTAVLARRLEAGAGTLVHFFGDSFMRLNWEAFVSSVAHERHVRLEAVFNMTIWKKRLDHAFCCDTSPARQLLARGGSAAQVQVR